jgi:hypothetical protein
MTMTPGLRKLGLTVHVLSSVGWLGAVATFLALAIAGLAGRGGADGLVAYVAMDRITHWVIVPFCWASLLTGVVQSLGTPWGLFRYYWVLIKLAMTALGTVGLLVHTRAIRYAAGLAAAGSFGTEGDPVRAQLVVTAAAAVVLLLVATALSVFKPRGLTPYGIRKQREE